MSDFCDNLWCGSLATKVSRRRTFMCLRQTASHVYSFWEERILEFVILIMRNMNRDVLILSVQPCFYTRENKIAWDQGFQSPVSAIILCSLARASFISQKRQKLKIKKNFKMNHKYSIFKRFYMTVPFARKNKLKKCLKSLKSRDFYLNMGIIIKKYAIFIILRKIRGSLHVRVLDRLLIGLVINLENYPDKVDSRSLQQYNRP